MATSDTTLPLLKVGTVAVQSTGGVEIPCVVTGVRKSGQFDRYQHCITALATTDADAAQVCAGDMINSNAGNIYPKVAYDAIGKIGDYDFVLDDDVPYFTLQVGPGEAPVWYFDIKDEFDQALADFLTRDRTDYVIGTADAVPDGDFVSDASEFIDYVDEQCITCHGENDDGEGWEGMCGDCADIANDDKAVAKWAVKNGDDFHGASDDGQIGIRVDYVRAVLAKREGAKP